MAAMSISKHRRRMACAPARTCRYTLGTFSLSGNN
jgi:hypothetical protein